MTRLARRLFLTGLSTTAVLVATAVVVDRFFSHGTTPKRVRATEGEHLHDEVLLAPRSKTNKRNRSSLGVPGLISSCGRIFENFPYTYQYKVASKDDCQQSIQMSPRDLPLTALASYPGSGNTWLRYLLQQATGLATGSMYCDLNLKRNGFFAESVRNGSVVAVKTHLFQDSHLAHFKRAILLTRDPRDALLADFNREFTHNHIQQATDQIFSDRWDLYWKKRINKWQNFHKQWFKFNGKLLLIHYECLKSQLVTELSRILEFLGMTAPAGLLNCINAFSKGQFKRTQNFTTGGLRKLQLHKLYSDSTIKQIKIRLYDDAKNNSASNMDIANQFLNNSECLS